MPQIAANAVLGLVEPASCGIGRRTFFAHRMGCETEKLYASRKVKSTKINQHRLFHGPRTSIFPWCRSTSSFCSRTGLMVGLPLHTKLRGSFRMGHSFTNLQSATTQRRFPCFWSDRLWKWKWKGNSSRMVKFTRICKTYNANAIPKKGEFSKILNLSNYLEEKSAKAARACFL